MKRFVFISLLFVVFQGIYSQKISNVDANQVGKKIEIIYDLDSTADVSVEVLPMVDELIQNYAV